MDAELKQQFDDMGIEPPQEVVDKSVELCITYHIDDASEFVEQWMAFSISHLHGAEPSIEHLNEFERKVFQAKREKELMAASKKKGNKLPSALANLTHLNDIASSNSNPLAMYGVEDDMMDDYMPDMISAGVGSSTTLDESEAVPSTPSIYHTPKAKSALSRTPARHNDALFSPASYSPIGTPRTHTAAPGSGKVVYTFGNPTLISNTQWSLVTKPKIHVKQLLQHNGECLGMNSNGRYMFDCLREKAEIAGDRVFNIGRSLCQKVFGEDAEDYALAQVDVHSQDTIKTIGTIFSDYDGPLDPSSTLLVGSDEMSCRTVRLNFSKTKSVGVFPGQVVMVSGMNPKGDIFMVEELFTEQNLKPPTPPSIVEQLSFVIAAGPYTQDDDLVYDPLQDLVMYLKEHRPNVLILCGPFMEAEHKLISDNITLAETFEIFFEKMITGIVEAVGGDTTILVVSSHRDANADCVYPTMPISLKKTFPNVHMLPDPSIVDLNGLTIGMTSTDIVDHILYNELQINAGDKVKRVVNYLLHQKSFYPLSPPKEDEMCFDSYLASKFTNIDQIPNILILPSSQKCFLRVVNGCLAINPGRLADNNGGTFARFIINPPTPKEEQNIYNFVGCQVRKV
ncbi:DNA polymerase alpha subunit B [Lucilia sericata]|uniref:DNA polymerase alpha subunit B n=1 Tax=Lucilia sericata TaxID=13632 RepID=UPI0018A7EF50|nr:DNA polymerase alpha subunit B [Lucilia sericata]